MKLTLTHYTIIVLFVTTGIASFGSYHYSTEYGKQKKANEDQATEIQQLTDTLNYHYSTEYEKQKEANGRQATEIQQLTDTLNYQNTHIDMLHEMDTKHTQELDNDKAKIDTLRADVAAARRKLRVQAVCSSVPETVASGSMGDAGTPQLTDAARQDYYDLLRMMAENERQTKYLQDYVNTECRGNDGNIQTSH
ncbi:lysis protein [Xenorhabdus bovienii]|uniref:lysis protein n=1 Tax=Xenorhabdus bovienii TaxID=40576 RepID=UPI00237C69EB|nr:lysis protein [Xenorhabdus bovienii]MDE1487717.1 lysis protein [Xenorhabdus bovienii]MDE9478569.1 lysis protein [Xenorhabdus bovienii]MDE9531456.1 lysis protein [Xenorhabdus bovienii]